MYQIAWLDSAAEALLQQSSEAPVEVREAAVTASVQIDMLLADNPSTVGESREPGTRVLIVKPVTVTYHINELKRRVTISGARLHGR